MSHPSAPGRRKNPTWIPAFFGQVPDVEPRLVTLLGFVSLALFFENYDFSLLGAALKHVAQDLQIAENQLGTFTAMIRLGALPAFLLIPFADVVGRRRLFLVCVMGLSVGTFLTGLSQTALQFVLFQILTRTFMLTSAAIAVVIVTEEFPAEHRGWGIGMLAALAAVGHGFGALLFAAVDVLPYGWRALYFLGVLPLFLLPRFRAGITETQRFANQERSQGGLGRRWLEPLLGLASDNPRRVATVLGVASIASLGHAVVFAFIGYFVQSYRGWEPWQYSTMVILCGAVGVVGNVQAGRIADRLGRRWVGFIVLSVFPLFGWMFFRGPDWLLPPTWIGLVLVVMAGNVIVRAFSTELFPTAQRGTSTGLVSLAETMGAGFGLLALSLVSEQQGDLLQALPWVAASTLVAAVLVLSLPETRQRELEEISASKQ